MYLLHVVSRKDYKAGVWRYSKFEEGSKYQNRETRYNLSVHPKGSNFGYPMRHWLDKDYD